MEEHVYKGNKIIEYPDGVFTAYYYAKEDDSKDIQQYSTDSLEKAQKRIDEYAEPVEELYWDEEDKKIVLTF